MKRDENKNVDASVKKAIFWGVIILLVILSYLIVKPFFISLMSAFVLAYLVKPVYSLLNKRIDRRISALFCILLVIILLLVPIVLIGSKLISQMGSVEASEINIPSSIEQVLSKIPFLSTANIESLKNAGVSLITSLVTSTLTYIPSILLSLLVTFFGMYYMLVYWNSITSELKELLPFKNKNKIKEEIAHTTTNIIHGYFFIAIVEFAVSFIGYYLAGVSLYLFFPFLTAVLAFIPLLGPGLVWVPLLVYYLLIGNYTTAIGVAITGFMISIVVERFIAPRIMQKTAKINPLIFLLGIIGGVPIFGIFGLIIGPLVLIYAIKLINHFLMNRE